MPLSDLEQLLVAPGQQEHKRNLTKLTTTMAYLIGVPWDKCKYYCVDEEELFEELGKKPDCRIMRSLCSIRTNLMLHGADTYRALKYDLKGLDDLEYYKADIKALSKEELFITKSNRDVNGYIMDINKLIADRINGLRRYFPEWIKWDYIKNLFIMPKGQKEQYVIEESRKFGAHRGYYPYTMYIYWYPEDCGNMLINDSKFVSVLYDQNNDVFTDYTKVKDAKDSVVGNIYEFIDRNESVQLVVDCENSDAFKLASMLKQLDDEEIDKIDSIVLYDDIHTTDAWGYLDKMTDVPIEHNIIERIKENKSLVDIKMGMGISKAYYQDGVTAFILLSSDSDFWGVISSLPDADFLVMVEDSKVGHDIQNALEQNGTYYCFIDDFATGNINQFKTAMLTTALEAEVGELLNVSAKELLDSIYTKLRLSVSTTEKQNFYERVVKKMTLSIDKDGKMSINVPRG